MEQKFTLTEVIICLSVALLLFGAIVPCISGMQNEGKDVVCVANKKAFAQAQALYSNDFEGVYVGYSAKKGWWYKVLTDRKYMQKEQLFCTENPNRAPGGLANINRQIDYIYGMPRLDWGKQADGLERTAGDCLEVLKDSDGTSPTSLIVVDFIKNHFIFGADAANFGSKTGGSYIFRMNCKPYGRMIKLAHAGKSAVAITDGSAKLMSGEEMAKDPGSKVRYVLNGAGEKVTLY